MWFLTNECLKHLMQNKRSTDKVQGMHSAFHVTACSDQHKSHPSQEALPPLDVCESQRYGGVSLMWPSVVSSAKFVLSSLSVGR